MEHSFHSAFFPAFGGVVSHFLFRKYEPNAVQFSLGFSLTFFTSLFLNYFFLDLDFLNIAFNSTWLFAIYLFSLSSSIVAYRLSPWHPLARYPGPVLARVTKLWSVYLLLCKGGRHKTLQQLHEMYGDWIRIGPNELSISISDAVQPIYLNLSRSSFYKGIPASADTLITIVDRKVHARRRRPWTRVLAQPALADFGNVANTRITQLCRILTEGHLAKPTDIGHWISLLLMDVIGDMAFSGGFETMRAGGDVEGWLDTLNLGAVVVAVLGQIPWLRSALSLLPQGGPIMSFHKFAKAKVAAARSSSGKSGLERNIFNEIVMGNHGEMVLSEEEAVADASLLIASSVETTSQAITTLLRYVIADQGVYQRLRSEIDYVIPADAEEIDPSAFASLPYLDACMFEALRLVPPAPAGPPRTTGDKGAYIVDRYIPPNTTVHIPTWTLHRMSSNFERADEFIPERWMTSDTKMSAHNTQAFIPFSVGYGACVGRQLAIQNIKLVICHLIRNFSFKFPEDFHLSEFDESYQECGLWKHKPFSVLLTPRT